MLKRVLIVFIMLMVGVGMLAQETPEPTDAVDDNLPPPEVTEVLLDPVLNIPIEPPFDITLPDAWQYGYDTIAYTDLDGRVEAVPIALYTGPIQGIDEFGRSTDIQGWIVLVWGYDTVVNPFSIQADMSPAWLDGQRMLRVLVFSNECVLGLAPQRDYTVGELDATGTQFSVVQCPNNEPDTRGWFAALTVDGINFAFYVYADPLQPVTSPFEFELQAILDTVEFHVAESMISPEEAAARQTQQAAEVTEEAP